MGLLSGVTARVAKHLIISPKMGFFLLRQTPKNGRNMVHFGRFGRKNQQIFSKFLSLAYGKIPFSLRCS